MFASSSRVALTLLLMSGLLAVSGCGERGRQIDAVAIESASPATPDEPIVLPLSVRGQVKLHNRWFDVFSDGGQIDDYLALKAQQYRTMYRDFGVEMEKRNIRGECLLTFPTEVIIEPESRTKLGYQLRLTRLCHDHGFFKVIIRQDGEDRPAAVPG